MILSCCRQLARPVVRLNGALRSPYSTPLYWQRLRVIQPITVRQQSFYNDQKSQHQSHTDTSSYTRVALAAAAAAGLIGGIYVILDARRRVSPQITSEGDKSQAEQTSSQPANNPISLQEAIDKSDELLQQIKFQKTCPGLVVAVTVDGQNVWSKGYGLADVENVVACKPSTVMRIASISKPLTMVALARLWEQGKLDLDAPIEQYVPSWPEKTFKGQKVTITTRQLVSMLGGIRHYDKTCTKHKQKKEKDKKKKDKKDKDKSDKDDTEKKAKEKEEGVNKDDKKKKAKEKEEEVNKDDKETKNSVRKDKDDEDKEDKEKKHKKKEKKVKDKKDKDDKQDKEKKHKDKKKDKEFEYKEYYIKKHFRTVNAALQLFKDDELCSLPGTEFLYSTYSWTLVSAVVEGASGRNFTDVMRDIFSDLGLENTYLDEDTPLIPNRARYYVYDKKKQLLVNAPYVDNSYKWAGGGFISTVLDLCHFGNAMLFSYQTLPSSTSSASVTGNQLTATTSGYLRPETVKMLWTPVVGTQCSWDKDGLYAMGWGTVPMATRPGFTRQQRMYVSHTGGAVGASSVLLILPRQSLPSSGLPRGVCVAIIVNTQSVGLNKTALKIAQLFDSVDL